MRALDASDVPGLLEGDELMALKPGRRLHPPAYANLIRTALLRRYGGVWADSTAYCLKPLDAWLPEVMETGFFAFAKPGPDRMLSNWFLAAEAGDYIIRQWYAACADYWATRTVRDTYHWHHRLFAEIYGRDARFRAQWDATPEISARLGLHFGPYKERLPGPMTADDRDYVDTAAAPMLKLSHRIQRDTWPESSVYAGLLERASRLPGQ